MQNIVASVLAKRTFVRDQIGQASEHIKTDFAFVNNITFIEEHINYLKQRIEHVVLITTSNSNVLLLKLNL